MRWLGCASWGPLPQELGACTIEARIPFAFLGELSCPVSLLRSHSLGEMSDWDDLNAFASDADEQAFARIVRRHVGLVHSAAHRVLKDRAAAEEVTCLLYTSPSPRD